MTTVLTILTIVGFFFAGAASAKWYNKDKREQK